MLSTEPGKRLKKMDEEMLKQFEDEEIQEIINQKAPGGIKIGKKSKVEVDTTHGAQKLKKSATFLKKFRLLPKV